MRSLPRPARSLRRSSVLAGVLLANLTAPCMAETIAVTTKSDAVASDGACSLREAITAANGDATSGASPGECPAGNGSDLIEVPAGHFVLSRSAPASENANASGDLDLLHEVTIHGAGAGRTSVDAARHDRVFDVATKVVATISDLTITGGQPRSGGDGATGWPNGAQGGLGQGGGGIMSAGDLTLTRVAVVGNRAGSGGAGGAALPTTLGAVVGGAGGTGGLGGAIFNSGNLTLDQAVVRGNAAGDGGLGAAATGAGAPDGTGNGPGGHGSPATGGTGGAGGSGGAIWNSGTAKLTATTISDNDAGAGASGGGASGGFGGYGAGNGAGGSGGSAMAGAAGPGGNGGGLAGGGAVTASASTFDHNRAGDGGLGGTSAPGPSGNGGANGSGANSAASYGGTGGLGGGGGAISAGTLVATNVTWDHNEAGDGGPGGFAYGGFAGRGYGNGSGGSNSIAYGGDGGTGGAGGTIGAGNLTAAHLTIVGSHGGQPGTGGGFSPGIPGAGGLGGNGLGTGVVMRGADGLIGAGGTIAVLGGKATISKSILDDNAPQGCSGGLADGGFNVGQALGGCPVNGGEPFLGALLDHGGPVATRALGAGSAARDLVPSTGAGCPATDARGVARPSGGACDAGAYEAAAPLATTAAASDIGLAAATLAGSTISNTGAATAHVEYGITAGYGMRTTDTDLQAGAGQFSFAARVDGLTPGTLYHYRVVAESDEGTGAGLDATFTTAGVGPDAPEGAGTPADRSEGSEDIPSAPVLTGFKLTPTRFRVAPAPTKAKRARKPTGGTKLTYALTAPATVTINVEQRLSGRAAGKACKGKRKCVRYAPRSRIILPSVAGANAQAFTGRIGKRTLRAGTYRATAVAVNEAGQASAPFTKAFTILSPRH